MATHEAKPFVIAVAGFLILLIATIFYGGAPLALSGRADLRQLYTAGYIVRMGQSARLYDYDFEREMQSALVSPEVVALPFDHPAYEALLFLPVASLGFRAAYKAFFLFNLVMLVICTRILWPRFGPLKAIWGPLPAVIVVCFLPITIALIQGQDSILLLALMAAAAVSLEKRHEILAGMLVGLGLFKFQFAIPIAVLFALWHRWRFLEGFAVSGGIMGITSAFICGQTGIVSYARLLLSISARLSGSAEQFKFGVYPAVMANLRGLCYVVFSFSTRAGQIATVLASVALLVYVARKRCSFDLAVIAAALLSYHGGIHDMSLLVIPAGVLLAEGLRTPDKRRIWLGALLLILPALLFLAGGAYFLLPLPMIAALWAGFEATAATR